MAKLRVWYVDDLQENLDEFERNHRNDFDIRLFHTPNDVLTALQTGQPDALLCDIFYYKTHDESIRVEQLVRDQAEILRQVAHTIRAEDGKQEGLSLIDRLAELYPNGVPFPFYAYTSKGPYLLDRDSFDKIAKAGAKWLFKKQYQPTTEAQVISSDVEQVRQARSDRIPWRRAWTWLVASGVVGAFLWDVVLKGWVWPLISSLIHRHPAPHP